MSLRHTAAKHSATVDREQIKTEKSISDSPLSFPWMHLTWQRRLAHFENLLREIYVRTDVWDPYCNASCAKPAFLCVQVYSGDESEVIRSSAVNSWPSFSLTIEVVTITDICHSDVRHCSGRLSCKIVRWTLARLHSQYLAQFARIFCPQPRPSNVSRQVRCLGLFI